jgi:hypothetical protein
MEWLARYHLREFMERTMAWTSITQENDVFPRDVPPLNLVYVMMGAIQTIFMMAPQIERSFGVDLGPHRPAFANGGSMHGKFCQAIAHP